MNRNEDSYPGMCSHTSQVAHIGRVTGRWFKQCQHCGAVVRWGPALIETQ